MRGDQDGLLDFTRRPEADQDIGSPRKHLLKFDVEPRLRAQSRKIFRHPPFARVLMPQR